MNILQIVSNLDRSQAGEDVIAATRFLTLYGHKVIVVSKKGNLVKEIDEVGARHCAIALRPNIFLLPFFILKISRIISRENISIVHARDGLTSFISFMALRYIEPLKVRGARALLVTVYKYDVKGFLEKAQFWAKRVICFSENQAQSFIKKGLLSRDKARVILPSLEPEPATAVAASPKAHFTIGAAVPFSSGEVTHAFVKTISSLSRAVSRMKVFISDLDGTCEKEHKEKLKLLIKQHSLGSIVTLLDRALDPTAVQNSDLFFQINTEGRLSARSLLRAQALGIPIVTTYAGWVKDYVEDNKASLCRTNTSQEMAQKISTLYKNPQMRKELAVQAKNFVKEKFNIKKIMASTVALYEEASSSFNILIIKIGALGDIILAAPSIRAIKEKFPKARISLLVGIEHREVFLNCPFVDEIIVCDLKARDKTPGGLLRIGKKLRGLHFDIVVDFQNNKKSHILSYLSCAPKRYGYGNGKLSFLLNRKAADTKLPMDPVEHQSKVLAMLGIYNIDKTLKLWPTEENEAWADNFLKANWVKKNTKLVALNIDSSPKWITKLWPVEYFAEIAEKLARNFGIRVILIGRERKSARIEEFLKKAKCKPIIALARTSVLELATLVKRCNLLISSDSAPLHVAASVGTPFIALFGPTDPKRHLVPVENSIVFKKDVKCAPCYHTYCRKEYICMRHIKPDEVYEAVLKLLKINKEK